MGDVHFWGVWWSVVFVGDGERFLWEVGVAFTFTRRSSVIALTGEDDQMVPGLGQIFRFHDRGIRMTDGLRLDHVGLQEHTLESLIPYIKQIICTSMQPSRMFSCILQRSTCEL